MKRYLLLLVGLFFSMSVLADMPEISLEKVSVNSRDMASIKRGAKFFSVNCMSCHTLVYLRYNALAKAAGIVYEKMPVNVKWPTGSTPPDLSLEADVRGVNWIYTYLHSFYADPKRPTGFNNLLVPNTMMPGIIAPFQGQQKLAVDVKGQTLYSSTEEWYDLLILQQQGAMSPQEFDATILDVVNFLAYATAPYAEQQTRLGWWVMGFLSIFFILVYLLKREYWKDVKVPKED